jgi:hypothetical protein
MDRKTEVDAHLRLALGTPVLSTSGKAFGRRAAFRVDTYADQPAEGAFTMVTVGLCETPLRPELLMCAWDAWRSDAFYSTLFTVADDLAERSLPVEQGMVLELPAPVVPESKMSHLFIYQPVYHLEDLQPIETAAGPVPVFWLVPITDAESRVVDDDGWEALDTLLLEHDPDLLDLRRDSMV